MRKLTALVLSVLCMVFCLPLSAFAEEANTPTESWATHYDADFLNEIQANYEQGYKTKETALHISSAAELAALAVFSDSVHKFEGKYIVLSANIDLSNYIWEPAFCPPTHTTDEGVTAIMDYGLAGTFDGCGHEISGLYINEPAKSVYALIGYVNYGGVVENMKVSGEITAYWNVGGIAGENAGVIRNCSSNVNISVIGYCGGGICGQSINKSEIYDCSYSGALTGGSESGNLGGIVGWIGAGTIRRCTNSGSVTGMFRIGGIAGRMQTTAKCISCINKGTVLGINGVGGIIGMNDTPNGIVEKCVNTGDVSLIYDENVNTASAGGIAGQNTGLIQMCRNAGSVTAQKLSSRAGGIAGFNQGTVRYCENAGSVSAQGSAAANAGGIVGYNYLKNGIAKVSMCWNRAQISNAQYAGGIVAYASSGGIIENCLNEGMVSSAVNSGGIAGFCNCKTVNCCNIASVLGTNKGAIAGQRATTDSSDTDVLMGGKTVTLTQSLVNYDFDEIWILSNAGEMQLQVINAMNFEEIAKEDGTKFGVMTIPHIAAEDTICFAAIYDENGKMCKSYISKAGYFLASKVGTINNQMKCYVLNASYCPVSECYTMVDGN